MLQHAERWPDDGVAMGAVPRWSLPLRSREPGADNGDQYQIQQPIEDGLLARLLLHDLIRKQRDDRRVPFVGVQDHGGRKRPQQSPADLAVDEVRTREHHGFTVRVVAPGSNAEIHRLIDIFTVDRRAPLTGMDDDLGWRRRLIGDDVRVRPLEERHITRQERGRFPGFRDNPGVSPQHRHHGQGSSILDPERPRWIEHLPLSATNDANGTSSGHPQPAKVLRAIRKRSFATLATTSTAQRPHVAGVLYKAIGTTLYINTLRSSRKARNIASNPHAAMTIPVRRLPVGPASTVHFQGIAEILDLDHPDIVALLADGRLKSLSSHGELDEPGSCFLRITPGSRILTHGLGMSLVELIRDPVHAGGIVAVEK